MIRKKGIVGLVFCALVAALLTGCKTGGDGSSPSTDPVVTKAIASGNVVLPASVTAKPYMVILDDDTDGSNGYIAMDSGTADGNPIPYSFNDITPGSYYIYAIVYNSGFVTGAPSAGDYFGAWSMTQIGDWPTSTTRATISSDSTNVYDFDVFTAPDMGGGDGSSTGTLNLSLPTSDTSILSISDTTPLIYEIYTDPNKAKSRTPDYTLTFTNKSQIQPITLPSYTWLYATAYYDSDNDGVDVGDRVGDLDVFYLGGGETADNTYYPLSSNMRAGKALVNLNDLGYILEVEYKYTGSVHLADDSTGAWMNCVVTTDGSNRYDTTKWVYAPNGGGAEKQRGNIGLDRTKSYYYFMYLDVDRSQTITSGDKVSATHALTFDNLSTYDRTKVTNSFTISDADLITY